MRKNLVVIAAAALVALVSLTGAVTVAQASEYTPEQWVEFKLGWLKLIEQRENALVLIARIRDVDCPKQVKNPKKPTKRELAMRAACINLTDLDYERTVADIKWLKTWVDAADYPDEARDAVFNSAPVSLFNTNAGVTGHIDVNLVNTFVRSAPSAPAE